MCKVYLGADANFQIDIILHSRFGVAEGQEWKQMQNLQQNSDYRADSEQLRVRCNADAKL